VSTPTILSAENVEKRYGGVHALRGASLEVLGGEVHALAGENGSGKSTLLKVLSGQVVRDAGRIVFAGDAVDFASPTDALERGIATVTQETTLVPDLSIAENIFLGRRARRFGLVDWGATRRRAREALGRLSLDLDPELPVRRLRPDQQQMVEIARALAHDSRLVILDEPTSSLTDDEVAALFAAVRRLRAQGVAVVFVSHRVQEIFEIADRITVLRDGRTVGAGTTSEIDRPRLIELMVGRALEDAVPGDPAATEGVPALRVRGLSLPGAFENVDLDVAAGEIVGLAGLVGAGRSELLEALFGLHPSSGSIDVTGEPARFRSPRRAVAAGVAFVPADRKLQGLVMQMSVRENLVMASSARRPRLTVPRRRAELDEVGRAVNGLGIRTAGPSVAVSTLSGGNQQKVVLGKWLATQPSVLMLDEPTRGVDVGAKAEIYRLLFEAATLGVGVLISSSETPELLTLCDRVAVMFRGRVVATVARAEATEAAIAHLAGGHR
jgi:ABC-type sugar transport system ATPase subunit